jgi:hypothetical protein
VLSTRAPIVPEGVTFGATGSFGGQAMRVIRDYDFLNVRDRLLADVFAGTNIVQDNGYVDSNGKFVPNDDDAGANVTISSSTGATITNSGTNGFVAGDRVIFTAMTGPTNLVLRRAYYVLATSLTATTFQIAATPGGSAITPAPVFSAGTANKDGALAFVRAVKLTDIA